jgi:hypothetical protein
MSWASLAGGPFRTLSGLIFYSASRAICRMRGNFRLTEIGLLRTPPGVPIILTMVSSETPFEQV